MKKAFSLMLLLATIAIAFQSCSSDGDEPVPEAQEVQVKLDYSLFESGSMSRSGESVYQSFYNEYIKTKELAPETYSLSFSSKATMIMAVQGKWGEDDAIRIKEGVYTVTGKSAPSDSYFSPKLYLTFNEDVNLTKEMTTLTLNAEYDCLLLMFNATTIKQIGAKFATNSGVKELPQAGGIYYLFVNSTTNSENRDLLINLTRLNGASVELNINRMGLEKGKYYYFNDITNSFDIDPMQNGNQ